MAANIVTVIDKIVNKAFKAKPVIVENKSNIRIELEAPLSSSKNRIEVGKEIINSLPTSIGVKKIEISLKGAKKFSVTLSSGDKKTIEIKEFKAGGSRQSPFTPAQVSLGGKKIVNCWLTIDEFVEITKKYVSKLEIPAPDKKEILGMIDDCTNASYAIRFNGNKKLVPSEFYEVLSSIKLASLISKKDSKAFKILGLSSQTKVKTVHIFIPQASNYPLTDYEISINGAHEQSSKKNERSTHKISVKSKVSSPKTNTVKFTDVFDSKSDVTEWAKRYGNDQEVQGKIALAGLSYPSGKKLYFPVDAIGKVIDKIGTGLNSTTKSAIKKVSEKVYTVKNPREIFIHTHYGLTKNENEALHAFVDSYVGVKQGAKEVPYTMLNILVACEKFLEKESQKNRNNKNMNFYQLFYDNVLKEKRIAYSVAKVSEKSVVFSYYTLVNWKSEYSDWISLRSKNSADNLNDTLGLDL